MIGRRGVILGVDPGLARVGWGVIETGGPGVRLVEYGSIMTSASQDHSRRLLDIHEGLTQVIEKHSPEAMAVEEIFQGKSARSALLAGEGRGACILTGARAGLPVSEYAASRIKQALTGNGRAAKPQVQAMVCRLLALSSPPEPHDAADALAVAITHSQRTLIRGF